MNGFELDFSLTRRVAGAEDFSLQVGFDTGDGITVVSGPSGAGKSTLLLAILGDLRPDRGRMVLQGEDFRCGRARRIDGRGRLCSPHQGPGLKPGARHARRTDRYD